MALKAYPGIECFRVGENRIPCADLHLNIEPYDFIVQYPGKVSCLWEIDNHIQRGRKVDNYQRVDKIFIAQKAFLPLYPKEKTTWLPLAADPDKHKLYPNEDISFDVGFIGNDTYPRRRDLLTKIGSKYKLYIGHTQPGEEYSRKLSRCKLLFNCSMDNDINMRVFEAMSIGRLLLTDKVEGMDDLFTEGEHYVAYTDWFDLDRLISHFLNDESSREKIAKAGAELIRAKHTYKDRLETILQTCGFY